MPGYGKLTGGLALAVTLTLMATPAAAGSSIVKFTIKGSGVSCVMTSASVACQASNSAATLSATLTPDSQVTQCSQPQGSSPGCVLWPGANYKDGFIDDPEPEVGPFACIPLGSPATPTGAVCTVVKTGKGFRVSSRKVSKVDQLRAGPHPPCTKAALSAALERAFHKRSLAPSFLAKGFVCAGNYARGDYIDEQGGTGDDITVVFGVKGRKWTLIGRGKDCEDGELPAQIYFACTVN